ncbi:Heat shock protein HSP 90-beta [Borealophlyctis nickersoniae]|nr:Heat shock protein HSP 90-beta [Borealophlyctis nickersoniae]
MKGLKLFLLLATLLALFLAVSADEAVSAGDADADSAFVNVQDPVAPSESSSSAAPAQSLPAGFSISPEDEAKIREGGEKFQFETEVNRLMKLIINSLYKTKEIFLRELISNASDALDKIRFLSLTNSELLGDTRDLKITIVADKERKTLTIADTGIGMTKKNLKENLGTIAKMEGNKTDSNLIGQFGVGFYSVFLVADSVTVVTKHNDDKQYIWESNSESDFSIIEDPRGNTIGRGTQIIMHLKDDALEYLQDSRLQELISKYSEFINFPIYLWATKTETEEVPIEEESEENPAASDEEVEDVTDKEKDEEKKPKTKTITKTSTDWKMMNQNKPIWTRRPSEVTPEEYDEFYMSFTKDYKKPMGHIHFRAEGDVEFSSILYISATPPPQFLQTATLTKNIKLFVRRVFIDDASDFLPRWLNFIKGLVDSDDLPLNVSRETLQQHSILKIIRKRLVAKAIEMIRHLAQNEPEQYLEFYKLYSNAIKMGVLDDRTHKNKLVKLLRFTSSKSDNLTSLEEYVNRMKGGQKQIYYIPGQSKEALMESPFVEKIIARGYEVLFFTEPIDEYLTQSLTMFEQHPLQNVGKTGVKFGDEDDKTEDSLADLTEKYKPLIDYFKTTLSEWVDTVRISKQLLHSPCSVMSNEYGVSGNMERIMQAQALANKDDFQMQMMLKMKKTLEINPDHPVIKALLKKVEKGKGKEVEDTAYVLFEATAVASGFDVRRPKDFAKKIEMVVRKNLGVGEDEEAKVEVVPAPEKKAEEVKEDEKAKVEEEESEAKKEEAEDVEHDEL